MADAHAGDLLPDDLYEPWAEEPREHLRLLHLDPLRLAGRWAAVAALDPADERAHGRPIEADRMYASAAALFDSSGQPFDAARCRAALVPAPAVQPAGG